MKLGILSHDHADPSRNGRLIRCNSRYATVLNNGQRFAIRRENLLARSTPRLGRYRTFGTGREAALAVACGLTVRQVREALA